MVERVILHVGFPKTGSSSIQSWLHENQDELLAKYGFLYPMQYLAFKLAHLELTKIFTPNSPDDLECIAQNIMLEAPDAETIILSCERWMEYELEISRLRTFLQHFNSKHVQIIGYVREHLDYTQSLWRERIHKMDKFTLRFSDYSAKIMEKLNLQISNIFHILEAVGHLDLRWYDISLLKNGNVVEDFCSLAGIFGMKYEIEDENPSLGGNLLLYKVARNLYFNEKNLEIINQKRDYNDLKEVARLKKKFRSPFPISDTSAYAFRKGSRYNEFLFEKLGPIPLRSWKSEAPIPDLDNLDQDFNIISQALNLHPYAPLFEKYRCVPKSIFELERR